jgi:hypothetical protein
VTGIEHSHEGTTDRKRLYEDIIELVINDSVQVARDNHFVLTILFDAYTIVR